MKVRRRVLVCINVDLQSVDLLNEGAAKEKNPLTVRLNPDVTARVKRSSRCLAKSSRFWTCSSACLSRDSIMW